MDLSIRFRYLLRFWCYRESKGPHPHKCLLINFWSDFVFFLNWNPYENFSTKFQIYLTVFELEGTKLGLIKKSTFLIFYPISNFFIGFLIKISVWTIQSDFRYRLQFSSYKESKGQHSINHLKKKFVLISKILIDFKFCANWVQNCVHNVLHLCQNAAVVSQYVPQSSLLS